MAKTLRGYLSKHKILSVVIGYFLFSVALNVVSGIDIVIPCLWTKFFGFSCHGCGMTTVLIHMINFDFATAWELNKLAFVVSPLCIWVFVRCIRKFMTDI